MEPNVVPDLQSFNIWELKIVVQFPIAKKSQNFSIVVIDFSTRWPIEWSAKQWSTETDKCFIFKSILAEYEVSGLLITIRVRELLGETQTQTLKSNISNIWLTFHTSLRLMREVERFNERLVRTLVKVFEDKEKNAWSIYLKHTPTSLNNS